MWIYYQMNNLTTERVRPAVRGIQNVIKATGLIPKFSILLSLTITRLLE